MISKNKILKKENELLKARNISLIKENDSLKGNIEVLQRKIKDSNEKLAKFFYSNKALNMWLDSQKRIDKVKLGFKENKKTCF